MGPVPCYSQAILDGVAWLRPTLVAGLSEQAHIPADRLAAAAVGQLELESDEIGRIEDVVELCAMELATATAPPVESGDELGALFMEMVDSERKRFQAARAATRAVS